MEFRESKLIAILSSSDPKIDTLRSKALQVPSSFQPLALANTPRPSIVRPDQYVGVTTYIGNGWSK
jgi:hypothetical protein